LIEAFSKHGITCHFRCKWTHVELSVSDFFGMCQIVRQCLTFLCSVAGTR
jgi:hypothetical protein